MRTLHLGLWRGRCGGWAFWSWSVLSCADMQIQFSVQIYFLPLKQTSKKSDLTHPVHRQNFRCHVVLTRWCEGRSRRFVMKSCIFNRRLYRCREHLQHLCLHDLSFPPLAHPVPVSLAQQAQQVSRVLQHKQLWMLFFRNRLVSSNAN